MEVDELMGYGSYVLPDGRQAGYNVSDVCNEPGCDEQIDRGLAYLCGEDPRGDEHGCTGYFCESHLFFGGPSQLCTRCLTRFEDEHEQEARLDMGKDFKVDGLPTEDYNQAAGRLQELLGTPSEWTEQTSTIVWDALAVMYRAGYLDARRDADRGRLR